MSEGQKPDNSIRPGGGRAGPVVMAVGLAGFVVMLVLSRCSAPEPARPEPGERTGYELFIADWNSLAGQWSPTYELTGDFAASPEAVIAALGRWLRPYADDYQERTGADMLRLAEELPGSAFHQYTAFRQSRRRSAEVPELTRDMDSQALARALNRLVWIDSPTLAPQTVREIIYHNDFCAFFYGERARLQARGWHMGAETCQAAAPPEERYPSLKALIRPDSPFYRR